MVDLNGIVIGGSIVKFLLMELAFYIQERHLNCIAIDRKPLDGDSFTDKMIGNIFPIFPNG